MKEKWTKEQAWAWYNRYPWLRGCNFIGSDCANRQDQWQQYDVEAHMATADRELALARRTGFNTIRIIADFDVWLQEEQGFMDNLERYLTIAAKNGQYVMLVLCAEVQLPRGEYADFKPKPLGEQHYALGYHQGRAPLTAEQTALPPYHPLESPLLRDKYLKMVTDIVTKYAHDERIIIWNVFNEPGIMLGERTVPMLETLFETVRACDPDQPLTADVWRGLKDGAPVSTEERAALELSDVVSFHSYMDFVATCDLIDRLKAYGRPLLCTEWLNRIGGNTIFEIYPLFFLERVACWCWGFVVGKTQTNEPWTGMLDQALDGKHEDLDFTKWLHDLYRPSFYPYDPKELRLIARVNALADRRDAEQLAK